MRLQHTIAKAARLFPRVPYCVPDWAAGSHALIIKLAVEDAILEGPHTERLERELAARSGKRYAVSVNLGRAALEMAIRGLAGGPRAEVLMPSFCCRSVATAILNAGATPVFADIDDDLNIDPLSAATLITDRTRAIVVPHIFGTPGKVEALEALARERGIAIVNDVAQALGASAGHRDLTSFGDVVILSFGAGKTVTATGGGVLLTDREDIVKRIRADELRHEQLSDKLRQVARIVFWRRLRRHTLWMNEVSQRLLRRGRKQHTSDCYSVWRLANIDAAMALNQLACLDATIAKRRKHAERFRCSLDAVGGLAVSRPPNAAAFTKFAAFTVGKAANERRDSLLHWLNECRIEIWPTYAPLHLDRGFRELSRGPLSRVEDLSSRVLGLPTEASMSERDGKHIVSCCKRFLEPSAAADVGESPRNVVRGAVG